MTSLMNIDSHIYHHLALINILLSAKVSFIYISILWHLTPQNTDDEGANTN